MLVCQNNQWSISVPVAKQTASQTIAIKGRAYGVPGVRVDGNDLLAVYEVVHDAIVRARSGGGPTFVEALTYRIGAHSTSDDPTRYRSEAEVDAWRKKDPLDRLRRHLVVRGLVDDARDATLDAEIAEEIGPRRQEGGGAAAHRPRDALRRRLRRAAVEPGRAADALGRSPRAFARRLSVPARAWLRRSPPRDRVLG